MERQKNGFTLIELLVVIAIIGLLSSVVMGSLSDARVKARNTTRISNIDQINKALEIYATGGRSFPSTNGVWVCIGPATSCWSGAYNIGASVNTALQSNISAIPVDPSINTGLGDEYLYNSNISPGNPPNPNGAYLSWVVENTGQPASSACGRGVYWQVTGIGYQCLLRIGNAS